MILPASVAERLPSRRAGGAAASRRGCAPRAPALIHAHFGTDGLKVLPLARALGVPLITHLRGYDVTLSRAALIGSGRPTWIRYALAARPADARRRPVPRRLGRARGSGRSRWAIRRSGRVTHYNGVDLDRFQPGDGPREPGLVLHVGRLVEKKGTAVLIDGAGRDRAGARLVVIGDGPLRGALERRAGARREGAFLGALPPDEVGAVDAARLGCSPRRASPRATATPKGCPTSSSRPRPRACRSSRRTIRAFPRRWRTARPASWCRRATRRRWRTGSAALLGSDDLRREMGAAARRLADERFDRARLTARLEAIYDEVAEPLARAQHELVAVGVAEGRERAPRLASVGGDFEGDAALGQAGGGSPRRRRRRARR